MSAPNRDALLQPGPRRGAPTGWLRRAVWLMAPLAALGCGPAADAQGQAGTAVEAFEAGDPETIGDHWVRVVRDDEDEPLAMQTAIVRFVPADDFQEGKKAEEYGNYVDLVGAVHIGDRDYYEALNERFASYDAVLFELVAPEGTVVPRGRGTSSSHPLGALQNAMKSMLEVEHQLEQVDYTRSNFVHADLSPTEFSESMDRRDESFLEMYFRVVGASLAQQSQLAAKGQSSEVDLMAAMFSEDRARRLKMIMAEQFEGMESLMLALSGPDGSTLITERNQRALDVLKEQLAEGHEKVAIFYGAGHLAEMQNQLEEQFEMRPVAIEWVEAWNLRPKAP